MTTKETLTLNQKTMELLQTKGNDRTSRIVRDHKMMIEYYEMERERYNGAITNERKRQNKQNCKRPQNDD
nr:MAG TPA: hypothetical protein [Caudoviricetes sp.]